LAQLNLQYFTVVRVFQAVYFGCAMSSSTSSTPKVPKSVIIVGSGAFGLSTAWALCRNPEFTYTSITVVDRQTFPTPDGSSVSELPQTWVTTLECARPECAICPQKEAALITPPSD
jgi:sarcosine oxidase/L-pipecolate oxidase